MVKDMHSPKRLIVPKLKGVVGDAEESLSEFSSKRDGGEDGGISESDEYIEESSFSEIATRSDRTAEGKKAKEDDSEGMLQESNENVNECMGGRGLGLQGADLTFLRRHLKMLLLRAQLQMCFSKSLQWRIKSQWIMLIQSC